MSKDDLKFVTVPMPRDMVKKLESLKADLQADSDESISRAEIVRRCISSVSSTADMGPDPVRVTAGVKPKKK